MKLIRPRWQNTLATASSFLIRPKATKKLKIRRSITLRALITLSNSITRLIQTGKSSLPKSLNSLTFISPARSRNKASRFSLVPERLRSAMHRFVFFEFSQKNIMDTTPFRIVRARQSLLYSPGLPERYIYHKQLVEKSEVRKETAKQWLIKQALWKIYLPAPRHIPHPTFDLSTPDSVHQVDLLFLPHNKLPRGGKV